MSEAAKEMKSADLDASFILFSMWTESVKNFAENGKGNVIFLDGSVEGAQRTMRQMMAMNHGEDRMREAAQEAEAEDLAALQKRNAPARHF
jgi:prepilin-type processing-associated H-X9-DG protein